MNFKQTDMKRIIAILLLVVFACGQGIPEAGAATRSKKVNPGDVASLVRTYNLYEGFDVVSVGGLGLSLVKLIGRHAVETAEEKAALDLIGGIRKIVVVEYEDASMDRKASFNRKMTGLLENAEKIVEVKEDGDTVNIYGMTSDDGEKIDDVIVFIPEECTLVCLFGSISSQKVVELIELEMENE